ncbi:hypothetical protein PoB_004737700 [Plakobranchus ocellatus]|uniref:Uncharacterized protein n=1 Tax=Plakobranchus ocellatus TaxID=259542 RepID=A0AAV4BNE4_9GAST|nr:hypothetical protein PoB_004737700 [Plakobranchus ocellatus]
MPEFLTSATFLGVLPVTARNTAGHTGSAGHRVRNSETCWANFVASLIREQASSGYVITSATLLAGRFTRRQARRTPAWLSPGQVMTTSRQAITVTV